MSRTPGRRGTAADPSPGRRWSPTAAGTVATVVGAVLAGAGLVLGRPDLALIGLPLLVSAAVGRSLPGAPAGAIALRGAVGQLSPSGGAGYEVVIEAPAGAELAVLGLRAGGAAARPLVVALPTAPLRGAVPVLHSGPQELVAVEGWLVASGGAAVAGPFGPVILEQVVRPARPPLQHLPQPPHLRGLSGGHVAAPPGNGGAFRDVGPHAPGDGLRRVDWRATARRARFDGDLQVRRTTTTADVTAVLVVDSRDDVGEVLTEWPTGRPDRTGLTSLDVAREAASALAAGTVRSGDRIGFHDLGVDGRDVPAGAGDRHLERVLDAIAGVRPRGVGAGRRRPAPVPRGALVYLLSTFLDDRTPEAALRWRAGGHRVVAVDVLPAARPDGAGPALVLAHRVLMLEHDDRLASLRARGVDVLRWSAGDADAQLRVLSRHSAPGRRQ